MEHTPEGQKKMPEVDKETASPSTCEILQIISSLEEGQSVRIGAKIGTLGAEWKVATAIKAKQCFMLEFDEENEEAVSLPFDDEGSTLLEANLWEIGWYKFLGTPAPHSTAGHSFEFVGSSHETKLMENTYTLFPTVFFMNGNEKIHINSMDKVLSSADPAIFYFAGKAASSEQTNKAIIYNCNRQETQVVELEQLELYSGEIDVDLKEVSAKVKWFVKSMKGGIDKNKQESEQREIEYSNLNDQKVNSDLKMHSPKSPAKRKRTAKVAKQFSPDDCIRNQAKRRHGGSYAKKSANKIKVQNKKNKTSQQNVTPPAPSIVKNKKKILLHHVLNMPQPKNWTWC